MTSKQRKQYMTLHAVRELVRGMAEHKQDFERKTQLSLERIERKVTGMLEALGEPTVTDWAYFTKAANRLRAKWDGEDEGHTYAAFVAIALTLVADQCALIPPKAVKVRKEFSDLEGMLATLYGHFDPELENMAASKEGEGVADEYRKLVAA